MEVLRRISNNFRLQVACLIGFVIVGALATLVVGVPWTEDRERAALEADMNEVLALQKETINGIFDKFRLMTGVVARQPDVSMLFRTQNKQIAQFTAEQLVVRFAGLSGAANVQFVRPDGNVLAQANNQRFAPQRIDDFLIDAASQGRLGRATLQLANGDSAYGFSKGVSSNGKIVGIVVVYVDLQQLGDAWGVLSDPIYVTDRLNRQIASNQLASSLVDLEVHAISTNAKLIEVEGLLATSQFMAKSEYLPLLDWRLAVLKSYQPVERAKDQILIIIMLSWIVVGGLVFVALQRRHIAVARLSAQKATARELEHRVQLRTSELRKEYDDRIAAEAALRQAQTELMQSAKLASIGQMSAALSHEYNQPIAAIRAYADNAQTFLEQGKEETAKDNLARISSMTERMAKLSKTLKSFARKPGTTLRDVEIVPLLREAQTLVEPHANDKKVELELVDVDPALTVKGGSLRLSQVLVNLLSNGIDAAAGSAKSKVLLTTKSDQKEVVFIVEDSGSGVQTKDRETIFDPFVSNKDVGEGLGLGLSIAYNIVHDFNGDIELGASQLGGAAFYVRLPRKTQD